MRDDYRIIDTDTHVGPNVETLQKFAGPRLLARWDELQQYYSPLTDGGHALSISPYPYRRRLGQSLSQDDGAPNKPAAGAVSPLKGNVAATLPSPAAPGVNNGNGAGRLADMDKEGVDVHLLIPATFSTAASALDPDLAKEIYEAYHRFIADYCSADPSRLKATLLTTAADPQWSSKQIAELADEPWLASVTVVLPEGHPLDDPDLDPIWAAMGEADLPLLHHSFFYEPPYFPGYRDVWDNVVVARAAAHPWGAERLVAYLTLSGMLDRFPRLRIGFAECSAGWLPGWLIRLQGQAEYMRHAIPDVSMSPLDYARSGRIFCEIGLYEGAAMAKAIIDICGDGVLMYQSDYPHPGSRFPNSPGVLLDWPDFEPATMRKLLGDNAATFLRLGQ